MALFKTDYGPATAFNVRGVKGGNAAELVKHLLAEIQAAITASEVQLIDFKVSGTGAGPNWEAWLVTGSGADTKTTSVDLSALLGFVAAVAGNPVEAELRVRAALAAVNAETPISFVYKLEVAGGGIGTEFLAVALYELTDDS